MVDKDTGITVRDNTLSDLLHTESHMIEKWIREMILEKRRLELRCHRAECSQVLHAEHLKINDMEPLDITHSPINGPDDFSYIDHEVKAFVERTG